MTVAELPIQLEEIEEIQKLNDERIARHERDNPEDDFCYCSPVDCRELARLLSLIQRLREEISFARQEAGAKS